MLCSHNEALIWEMSEQNRAHFEKEVDTRALDLNVPFGLRIRRPKNTSYTVNMVLYYPKPVTNNLRAPLRIKST